jgi:homogentisate 1,2-dioxygenase
MNITVSPNLAAGSSTRGQALAYLSGFGNGFETEALAGALPVGRNSPQKCPYGLYAEQLSGSLFTAPRATNERSWLYRIRPTVSHWGRFEKVDHGLWRTAPAPEAELPISPLRWGPIPIPKEKLSFVNGIRTITTAGNAGTQAGMGAHVYLITRSMEDEYFYNADGEMLLCRNRASCASQPSSGLSRSSRARSRSSRVA